MRPIALHGSFRICVIFIMLWMTGAVHAQNNPYKIDDRLYTLYVKANNHRKDSIGLLTADTLRRRAIAMGDKKAEILALIVPMQFQAKYKNNYNTLQKLGEQVRKKSLEYNYLQYYFFTTTFLANYLSSWNDTKTAIELLRKDIAFAEKREHPYGVLSGYKTLGNIHFARKEYIHAMTYYHKALDYAKTNLQERERAAIYLRLCQTLCTLYRFKELGQMADEGLNYCYTDQTRGSLLGYKAIASFMEGNYPQFEKTFTQFLAYTKYQLDFTALHSNIISLMRSVFNTKEGLIAKISLDSAIVRQAPTLQKFGRYLEQMYNEHYDMASASLDNLMQPFMTLSKDDVFDDMLELSGEMTAREINLQNQTAINRQAQLQLEHSQLELHNADLELGRSENARHLAQVSADRNKLKFHNQKLRSSELRDSLANQQNLQKLSRKRHRMETMMVNGVSALVILLIILTLLYLWHHQKREKRLKELEGKLHDTITEYHVMNEHAQEADRKKSQFIQNMSHEVRTPLNAIVGFSQVLTDMGDMLPPEEKTDLGERITQNSELLSTLINDILELTSIESGRYEMKQEEVTVNALCQKALKDILHRLLPGVKLVFNTDLDDRQTVVTDAKRIEQVLVNLLTNATKNTTSGSISLECSSTRNPGMLTFVVTDTGVGVPKEKMEEIFDRFNKVDTFKQGSGLGLGICRAISKRLGGSVGIDPDYTGGARFIFQIPYCP